ncbi:hypothetical protein MaudCBS49596_000517 [Microsporum audouinii]
MTTPLRPLEVFISRAEPGVILDPDQSSRREGKLSRHRKSSILDQNPESTRLPPYKPTCLPRLTALKAILWKCTQSVLSLWRRLFPAWYCPDNGRLLFKTAYGLRLIVHNNGDTGCTTIEITASQSPNRRVRGGIGQLYHYRLAPDWQTSFLWYDTRWPHNPPGEAHVDEETIEERYPTLAPFYFAWQTSYEDSFTAQGCDRGSSLDVFFDAASRVGWEVGGFLFACWLVLQGDVEQVKYEIATGTYSIRRENLSSVAQTFLADVDALL